MLLGLIATTSLSMTEMADDSRTQLVDTPYGPVLHEVLTLDGVRVVMVRRSGGREWLPPHRVNYRANLLSFKLAGVTQVIATNLVGSLDAALEPGKIVLLDQFIDLTSTRAVTAYDHHGHRSVDMTHPYCERLRRAVSLAAQCNSVGIEPAACYVGVDGPRYETAAEVRAYRLLGGDVVGMTGTSEAVAAREVGLCYAGVALVSNFGAGIETTPVDTEAMLRTAQTHQERYRSLIRRAIGTVAADGQRCSCQDRQGKPTQPSWRGLYLQITEDS